MDAILYWNYVTLQSCANDYNIDVATTPDQVGPTTTARAFAIIHGAMYHSVVVFHAGYKSLYNLDNAPRYDGTSKRSATDAAVMEAAYQTLYVLYPKQRPIFDAIRNDFLKRLESAENSYSAINKGITIGQWIAKLILDDRRNDGSAVNVQYRPINQPGYHQVDPLHPNQGFLGANWGNVKPFIIQSGSQFRPPNRLGMAPEERLAFLNSDEYIRNYIEVERLGAYRSSARTDEQTEIGITWAYDGAPKIGVPPRLFNQVVRVVAIQEKNSLIDNARLFAMINYGMGDASIAAWDSKYFYNFWRPIVGIRNAVGATTADPNWEPLGAPSDGQGTDFTPNFPSFVSGHSTFGSACFEILRLFYDKDSIYFQFQSDEYNGKTIDTRTKQQRPAKTRTYRSFTQAEEENFLGRIYLGVHWRIDQEGGQFIGQNIGKFVHEIFSGK